MAKTGPNDASGVVWTLGEVFFFLCVFFFTNLCLMSCVGCILAIGRAMATKTGPNDVSSVVWTRGEFFFPSCFLYTN